jgi:uncharacterized membrane protein
MTEPIEPADADAAADAPAPVRFGRDQVEFGRALAYFDATFAIATTLLVTTLATGEHEWSSWSAFRSAISGPIFAYALSFLVVSTFWWANHRFVSSLQALSPNAIKVSLFMLAFVVLLPFTTEGLGAYTGVNGQVPTIVYAVNVAAVSLSAFLLFRVAIADGLYTVPLGDEEIFEHSVGVLDVPLVFLASVPIALVWTDGAARYSWLALAPLGFLERRWFARRRARGLR